MNLTEVVSSVIEREQVHHEQAEALMKDILYETVTQSRSDTLIEACIQDARILYGMKERISKLLEEIRSTAKSAHE